MVGRPTGRTEGPHYTRFLMDTNDGVGFELRNGRYREVDAQCFSAAGARREHMAGKPLRAHGSGTRWFHTVW